MKLTIRERGQRVAQYLWSKGKQTIRGIARATGLSTSSVYRHQQGIERRAQCDFRHKMTKISLIK